MGAGAGARTEPITGERDPQKAPGQMAPRMRRQQPQPVKLVTISPTASNRAIRFIVLVAPCLDQGFRVVQGNLPVVGLVRREVGVRQGEL